MKKARIAIPSYSGEIGAPTMIAVMRAIDEGRAAGWQVDVDIRPLDSLLPRCRNHMLTQFMATDASDLVFWDADLAPAPGGFARLLAHPAEVVGATYRCRSDPERYIFRPLSGGAEDFENGLVEVEALGTGFLRIGRAAVERMREKFPENWIDDRGQKLIWLFDFELRDHQYFSEDFVFCRRFREAGGRVWMDSHIPFFHTGPKTFVGTHADFLRRELAARTTPDELAEAQSRIDALFASYLQT